MVMFRFVRITIATALLFCLSAASAISANICWQPTSKLLGFTPGWIEDTLTGCKLWGRIPSSNNGIVERMAWSGDCINGLAEGEGTVKYFWGDIVVYEDFVYKEFGASFRNGKPVYSLNKKSIKIEVEECHEYVGGGFYSRSVAAQIPNEVNTRSHSTSVAAAAVISDIAKEICTDEGGKNIWETTIRIYQESRDANVYLANGLAVCANNPLDYVEGKRTNSTNLTVAIRSALSEKVLSAGVEHFHYNRRIVDEMEKTIQSRQRLNEKIEKVKASRMSFENFSKKVGVVEWPDVSKFRANPFVYEDNLLGLWVTFEKMIEKEKGLFWDAAKRPIIIEDIPVGTYTEEVGALVAARFQGREYIELPAIGNVDVPVLVHKGSHICDTKECTRQLYWIRYKGVKELEEVGILTAVWDNPMNYGWAKARTVKEARELSLDDCNQEDCEVIELLEGESCIAYAAAALSSDAIWTMSGRIGRGSTISGAEREASKKVQEAYGGGMVLMSDCL